MASDPKYLGVGESPDVAFHLGRWWIVWQGGSTLHLVSLWPDSLEQVSATSWPVGEPGVFARLLSWRGRLFIAHRDGTADFRIALRELGSSFVEYLDVEATPGHDLGHGSDPVALGAGYIAWQATGAPEYQVWRKALVGTEPAWLVGNGRPTGLSRILPDGTVRLVDDDREVLTGYTRPCWAGDLAVAEGRNLGAYGRLTDGRELVVWPGEEAVTPRCAWDGGDRFGIATWGAREGVRFAEVTRAEFVTPSVQPQPERLPEGAELDLFPYLVGEASTWPRHGDHYMHQVWDGRNLTFLKFGPIAEGSTIGDAWERLVIADGQSWLREDRSQSGAGIYSMHPGRSLDMRMRVGQWIDQPDNILQRYAKDGCRVIDQHPLPYRIGLREAWKHFDCGGDLGLRDVIKCSYDPGNDQDTIEHFWYAKGAGWFRWQEQRQDDPSRTHTQSFNRIGGVALTPTQGCWRRDLVPWPPKPPDPKPPPPKPDPQPEPVTMTNFRTSDGAHYLCAEAGGGREIVANRTEPGAWETFEVVKVDATHIALKANNGQFVCAEDGGGRDLVANRSEVGAWETFEVVPVDGGIALRTSGGQFVCAENGGGGVVVADRADAGAWETFVPSASLTGGGAVVGGPVGAGAIGYLPPAGQMRMEGWSMADDHGPRSMLSATLMDGITQFVRDQMRLARNIDYGMSHGVDFFRILGEVDWPGGEFIPRAVERCVDFLRYALGKGTRIQLTIFGSHSHIDDREALAYTEALARAIRDAGLEIVLALVEIINEPGGARWGVDRMRRHAEIVRRYLPHVPIAFGAPYQEGVNTTTGWEENEHGYAAYRRFCVSPANLTTPHTDRGSHTDEGEYRHARQPYICAMMDYPYGNNEPGGPGASAQHADAFRDPTMQRVIANGAWLSRAAFHCWHTNAGVSLNTDSLLEVEPGLSVLSASREIIPRDIANYRLYNWNKNENPFVILSGIRSGGPATGIVRNHALIAGNSFVEHIIGCDHGAEFRAKRGMRMTRYQWNGQRYAATWAGDVHGGSRFNAPADNDLIYVGEFI